MGAVRGDGLGQLGDRVAVVVRHPDTGAVRGDGSRGSQNPPRRRARRARAARAATARPGEDARKARAKRAPPITIARLAKRPTRTRRCPCRSHTKPPLRANLKRDSPPHRPEPASAPGHDLAHVPRPSQPAPAALKPAPLRAVLTAIDARHTRKLHTTTARTAVHAAGTNRPEPVRDQRVGPAPARSPGAASAGRAVAGCEHRADTAGNLVMRSSGGLVREQLCGRRFPCAASPLQASRGFPAGRHRRLRRACQCRAADFPHAASRPTGELSGLGDEPLAVTGTAAEGPAGGAVARGGA